jgi:thioredoxin-like negative regulator of GroEL
MNLVILTILIFSIRIIHGNSQNEGVTELNNDNFSKFILDQEHVFVMFHSPNCIHSLKLLPIIKQVAKMLADQPKLTEIPLKIAIVNIIKETDLAYRFDIKDTPKLKFFRENNLVYSYDGPRDSVDCK